MTLLQYSRLLEVFEIRHLSVCNFDDSLDDNDDNDPSIPRMIYQSKILYPVCQEVPVLNRFFFQYSNRFTSTIMPECALSAFLSACCAVVMLSNYTLDVAKLPF